AADSLVQGKLAPPDRAKQRAVKLGDFTALRPFRRRGAFSTGRKGRERTLARSRERAVGGGRLMPATPSILLVLSPLPRGLRQNATVRHSSPTSRRSSCCWRP